MQIKEPQPLVPGGKFPTITDEDLENRFSYDFVDIDEKKQAHETIRNICLRVAIDLNNIMPDCREKALAILNLEEVMFWANAGIARRT